MDTPRTAFVTGITGNQGYAVARHLLKNEFQIYGLTRNSDAAKARRLEIDGVQLVEGDLDRPETYTKELNESKFVFFVQALQGKQQEVRQGKVFIDTLNSNLHHLVYASVLGADLNTGVPHFDSKYELENYIRFKDLSYTIIRPASFYDNHLMPQVMNTIKKGKYVTPLKRTCVQQMIGVEDIGHIVATVMSEQSKYKNKVLSVATDEYKIGDIPQVFAEVLKQEVAYRKLPGLLARLFMGKDLHKMFKYMNRHSFKVIDSIEDVRQEFNISGDFRSWITTHFSNVLK